MGCKRPQDRIRKLDCAKASKKRTYWVHSDQLEVVLLEDFTQSMHLADCRCAESQCERTERWPPRRDVRSISPVCPKPGKQRTR